VFVVESPTKLRILGYDSSPRKELLAAQLEYKNKPVEFEIKRMKNSAAFTIARIGEEAYFETLEELKKRRIGSLLFSDEKGFWTYSGLASYLANAMNDTVRYEVQYPQTKLIPFANVPDKKMRYYQEAALEKLIEKKHAAVEIGTGLGKSFIILNLIKRIGLQTVVMAPSRNIADQLLHELTEAFGKKYVGCFYGGKKQIGKLITVAIGNSLTLVSKEEDPEIFKFLSETKVFIADESHMTPAETLEQVCMNVLSSAPYRFFFSGTQTRGDGKERILEGIIGDVVYEMTVRDGVDQGFLSKPDFIMLNVCTDSPSYMSKDPMRMTRKHLYYNANVNAWAAEIANKSVNSYHRPTLILVEEIEQFTHLLPHLRCDAHFAHGPLSKEQKKVLPEKYHTSNPGELVKAFDQGRVPLLIGTSCISTGTDIKSVQAIIYLQGGASDIQVRQAVGRGTRLFPGKKNCLFYDFDVMDVDQMHRHASIRKSMYDDIYGPVKVLTP
jgi:superfamily II DNA or RNA helicase